MTHATPAHAHAADASAPDAPARTILLVEDSSADRATLRRLLREGAPQHTIVEARTGAEGLALAREARPGCILLDFRLPDMDGTDFLAALAVDGGRVPGVPVALFTGHEDRRAAALALKRGAQDYVVKGTLNGSGIARVIENAIEKFAILRELEQKRAAVELRNWQLETLRDELQGKLLELADATRAREQFMAVMSHEMRTPLNAILGYADLLGMEISGPLNEQQRMHLGRISVGGRHLLDLVNDVLDLARSTARKLELDMRPVDAVAVVEEVVTLLQNQAGAKGITLAVELPDGELPAVQADLQRLRQVLTNLVGNAIKFTDEGSVTVRLAAGDDDTVLAEVADTGIGIAADVVPLVFNEFYQAEHDLTRQYGGSGLGLAIAQRLVRQMGGDIHAASTLGEGSTFTVTLQAAQPDSALRPEDTAAHASRLAVRTSGETRAPAEEEPAGLLTVVAFGDDRRALEELGRQVRPRVRLETTTDCDAVPALVQRERPSLVVLDISSREGGAWRAAQALQELPDLSETAILLLPGIPRVREDEAPGSLNLGWLALVPKPFTAEQLGRAVTHAAQAGGRAAAGAGIEALVVDDDEDSRRVAARFLGSAGMRVREVPDGESALVAMRRHPPDVVVLDLMMPVLDGFGVLAAMRADPALAAIPTVVLSAKSLSEAERDFLARTAVRVLQKGEHRLADVAALVLRAAGARVRASATDAVAS